MYSFNKIDDDTYELDYKGKKYEIKKDIEKVVDLQAVDFEARVLMNQKLKDMKATIDDLQYVKVEDGKTIIDDSQAQKALEACKKEAMAKKTKVLIEKTTGLNVYDLALDLGTEEFEKFCRDFMGVLMGQQELKETPSEIK